MPEEQIEEWLLVIRAARLTQNVKRGVVLLNLPRWNFEAVGTAGDPDFGQLSGFDALRPRCRERK
jgi:hypothetical protein